MVYRSFQVRQIEEGDRAKWEGWAQAEEERGDFAAAQGHRDFLEQCASSTPRGVTLILSGQPHGCTDLLHPACLLGRRGLAEPMSRWFSWTKTSRSSDPRRWRSK